MFCKKPVEIKQKAYTGCYVSYRKLDCNLKCQYQRDFGPGTKRPFIEFDNRLWCPFHLPMKNLTGLSSEKIDWNTSQKDEFYLYLKMMIAKYIENKRNAKEAASTYPNSPTFLLNSDNFFKTTEERNTIDLSYTIFPNDFSLSDLTNEFDGHDFKVNLQSCEFHCTIDIKQKTIKNYNFSDSAFYNLVSFTTCKLDNASFSNTLFHKASTFDHTTIRGSKFDKSKFYENASFSYCKFLNSPETEQKLTFDKAAFYKNSFFTNSLFENSLSLTYIKFLGMTDFSILKDPIDDGFDDISFQGCSFQVVKFTNRKFRSKTDFSLCTFNEAPQFYGCTFHQHTIFPSQKNFKGLSKKEAAPAFRVLYGAMAELKNRGYESMFYALVQKSERKSKTQPWPIRLASLLYELISNYGQSIGRPLVSLLIVTAAFSCLYACLASPIISWHPPIDWNLVGNGFGLSIKQIIKPFSLYAKQTPIGELIKNSYPIVFMSAAISQAIISLALIALFLLAIRWNFKKD